MIFRELSGKPHRRRSRRVRKTPIIQQARSAGFELFLSRMTELLHITCHNCGADLHFSPSVQELCCPFCDSRQLVDMQNDRVQEIPLQDDLKRLPQNVNEQAVNIVELCCQKCGYHYELPEYQASSLCPSCNSPHVITSPLRRIQPTGIIPFLLSEDDAEIIFHHWIKRLWFAPSNIQRGKRHVAKWRGMYLPMWTIDAQTDTRYSGERGDAYYVTERKRVWVSDHYEEHEERVRKIRWSTAVGDISCFFDDILIDADQSQNDVLKRALGPWNLRDVVNYHPEYSAGFDTLLYQIEPQQAFKRAELIMQKHIHTLILSDIGGDEQRIYSKETRYSRQSCKFILFPVWSGSYRFGHKQYVFSVNAQTGKISGERPYSAIKIIAAIMAVLLFLLLLYYHNGGTF